MYEYYKIKINFHKKIKYIILFLMRFILFIILWLPLMTLAQQPFFYKLDDENGFQSNEVYQLEQDKFGFIWIGCDAGLFRYDGVKFKQYTHAKQNGISISNLIIDEEQRVWCQNFSGQVFYVQHDSMTLFKDFTQETASYPDYTIYKNQLIITIHDSTRIYNTNTNKLQTTFLNQSNVEKFFPLFFCGNDDGLYASNRENIYYKAKGKSYIELYKTKAFFCPRMDIIRKKVYAMMLDSDSQEWLITEFYNGKMLRQKRFPPNKFIPNTNIHLIAAMKDGFAICTATGVYILNENFEITHHYFPDEKIADALHDREGNLWLTSLQNGIYVIPSTDLKIYSDTYFPNANVTALTLQNQSLLLGTYSGDIYAFLPQKQTFQKLNIEAPLTFKTVKRIMETEDYQIFAVGIKTTLLNKKTKQKITLGATSVREMLLMNDSLYVINPSMFQVGDLKANSTYRTILDGGGRMLTKDTNSDTLFVANKNGFYYYINGKITEILRNRQPIFVMCAAWQQDTLWLGTLSDGFLAYHKGRFFHHFLNNDDANGNMIRSMKIYKNWLLVATNLGMIKMDLRTKKMQNINKLDGLNQKEIKSIEVLNDEIFLATTKGLIRFPLFMKVENHVVPNIKLYSVIVNDSLNVGLNYHTFQANENNVLFQFQTALFRSRKGFFYEYRLKGLNDNWQKTDATAPYAQYRSLPPGRYTFEVRAVNEDGVRSKIQSFKFFLSVPIWKRWWFILLIFSILATFVYWLVHRRIQNIKHQAMIENELKTSQLTALKAQMNPHFLYNALNSIQDLILQKDIPNASRYLTKFSHLMRQILEASGHLSIPLSTEIRILNLYLELEKLRFGDDFQYEITFPELMDLETVQVPSMIIQPFVENAVKHGLLHKIDGLKMININFEIKDLLICTITDNGIGRENSEKIKIRQGKTTTSFATSATQKRLEILNQTHQQKIGLEIIDLQENGTAMGTKALLRIPFTSF